MINDNPSSDLSKDAQVLLAQLMQEMLRERRRGRVRRWLGWLVFITVVVFSMVTVSSMEGVHEVDKSKPHVGLIDLKGTIFDEEDAGADNFIKSLTKAYQSKALKALILRIDSPGGSPVQADYMYSALDYYRKKYPKIKVYAVCVDMCASAAYYVAAAADEIYANPSSIVGSIGVIYNGFGFVDAMQKLGVSRRLVTAGRNKGFMDQFLPVNPDQEVKLQVMLDLIHQSFIERVKAGRGSRLSVDEDTFSGLFWTGTQAKQRGLIDGFASAGQVARDVIHLEDVVDYSHKENPFDRMAKRIGVTMARELPTSLGMRPGIQ